MDASSEFVNPNLPDVKYATEYVNDNNWYPEVLNVPDDEAKIFVSAETGGDILVLTLKANTILKKVVLLPSTKPEWQLPAFPGLYLVQVYVSEEKPNVDYVKNDPKMFVQCGTFYQKTLITHDILPIAISCEKCMPYGKYVTVQLGMANQFRISEIALYGHEIEL